MARLEEELRARLQVGARMVDLQQRLATQVRELQEALSHIHQLQGILPICAYCSKVRGDQNYWQRVEAYVSAHTELRFSHSICPHCYETVAGPELEEFMRQGQAVG